MANKMLEGIRGKSLLMFFLSLCDLRTSCLVDRQALSLADLTPANWSIADESLGSEKETQTCQKESKRPGGDLIVSEAGVG
jgi:hypothetical protein